jgi:hypothetical protein
VGAALAITRKVAKDGVEAYRLAGTAWCLLGRRHLALHWWGRSVAEGMRLGARPELARTWLEIARRLAPGETIDGVDASAARARGADLLSALGLEHDLDDARTPRTSVA